MTFKEDPKMRGTTDYTEEDARNQWVFAELSLKACNIGSPNIMIPALPAFFMEFTLSKTDGSDRTGPMEVYVSAEDLGDIAAMCSQGLGKLLQLVSDERTDFVEKLLGDEA